MDGVSREIAEFVVGFEGRMLSRAAVRAVKLRLLDTVACGWGGANAAVTKIVGAVVGSAPREGVGMMCARLFGGGVANVSGAAFSNGVAVRYLDFNDFGGGASPNHASDMIPGLMAVAESVGASGADVISSVAIGYEVLAGVAGALREKGMRAGFSGTAQAVAAAAGSSLLLGLDEGQVGEAVSLAALTSLSSEARAYGGELSMWKGCAGPWSAQQGVTAALLAERGLTGVGAPFEGRWGVFDLVCNGGRVRAPLVLGGWGRGVWRVEESMTKVYPAEMYSQTGIIAAIRLASQVALHDIEDVVIITSDRAIKAIGLPERWEPRTRFSADHSLPYIVATALCDGEITGASFDSEEKFDRAIVRQLIGRTTVVEDEGMSKAFNIGWPGNSVADGAVMPTEVRIRMRTGETLSERVDVLPRVDQAFVEGKLRSLVGDGVGLGDVVSRMIAAVDGLDGVGNVGEVVRLVVGGAGLAT